VDAGTGTVGPANVQQSLRSAADAVIRRWGLRSWFLVGVVVLTAVAYVGLAAVSGLVVPLVVAAFLGMLFASCTPLCRPS
jgi:hypothetical protein